MPDTNPTESDYPIRVDEYHFPVDAVRDVAERIALGKGEVDEDGYYWLKWEDVNNLQLLSIGEYCSLYFYETNKEDLRCLYWLQPLTQEGVPVSTAFTFKVNTESEEYEHLDVSDFLPDDLSVKSMVLKGKAKSGTTGVGSTLVAYNFANCKYDSLSLYNMGVGLDTYSDEDKYFFDSEDFEVGSRLVFNGSSLWVSECKFSCPYKHIVLDVKGDFHYEACTFFIDDDLFDGAILYSNTGSELEHLSLFNHGESASSPKTSNLTKVYVSRLGDDFDLDAGTVSLLPKEDTYVEGKEYYFYYPEGDGKWAEIIAKSKEIDYVENGGWSSGWANEWVCLTYDDGQVPPTPTKKPLGLEVAKQSDYPVAITEKNFPNEWVRNYATSLASEEGLLKWEDAINNTDINLGSHDDPVLFFTKDKVEYTLEGVKWFMPADADGNTVKYNLTLWLADNGYYTVHIPLLNCMNSDSVNRLLIGDALFFEDDIRGAQVFNLSQMNVTSLDLIGLEVVTSDAEEVWWLDTNSMFVRDADKTNKLFTPAKEVEIAGCDIDNADFTQSTGLYLSNAVEKLTVNDTDSNGMFSAGVYLGGDYSTITNPIEASFTGSGTVFVDNSNYNYVESAYSTPSMDEWKLTKYS